MIKLMITKLYKKLYKKSSPSAGKLQHTSQSPSPSVLHTAGNCSSGNNSHLIVTQQRDIGMAVTPESLFRDHSFNELRLNSMYLSVQCFCECMNFVCGSR